MAVSPNLEVAATVLVLVDAPVPDMVGRGGKLLAGGIVPKAPTMVQAKNQQIRHCPPIMPLLGYPCPLLYPFVRGTCVHMYLPAWMPP